jgi:hypothetical protein
MVARIVGYVLTVIGLIGFVMVNDPDVRYPSLGLAALGIIAVVEGTVSQITKAVRR